MLFIPGARQVMLVCYNWLFRFGKGCRTVATCVNHTLLDELAHYGVLMIGVRAVCVVNSMQSVRFSGSLYLTEVICWTWCATRSILVFCLCE